MKIISKNENRVTCSICGTIYEYEASDVKPIALNCGEIRCPECGHTVYLIPETKLVPHDAPIDVGLGGDDD